MTNFLLYLLESSILLTVLFLVYRILLRKDCSFSFNRFYLLFTISSSLLLPKISFEGIERNIPVKTAKIISDEREKYYQNFEKWYSSSSVNTSSKNEIISDNKSIYKANILIVTVYLLLITGITIQLTRFLISIYAVRKLSHLHQAKFYDGIKLVVLPDNVAPFSFLNTIFISQNDFQNKDSFNQIFEHERIHIQQRHSYDLIFVQLITAVFWFNPVSWWLSKSLKTTHEYIVDEKMIQKGYSRVAYQSLLLRQLISNQSCGLVHNFNLSFIKKRITMMNTNKSVKKGILRTGITMLLAFGISLFVLQCNSLTDTAEIGNDSTKSIVQERGNDSESIKSNLDLLVTSSGIKIENSYYSIKEFDRLLAQKKLTKGSIIRFSAEANLDMSRAEPVFELLRKHDLRKVLFESSPTSSAFIQQKMLLPPLETNEEMVVVDVEDVLQNNDLDKMLVNIDEVSIEEVTQFVEKNINHQNSDYVVIAQYFPGSSYMAYLKGLKSIHRGFENIYEERAKKFFDKSFSELTSDETMDVRKGVPGAVMLHYKN